MKRNNLDHSKNHVTRVWFRLQVFVIAMLLTGIYSCDIVDPTGVTNPQSTAEDLANAREPVRALLPGVEAQFARAVRATVTIAEVVSDNYSINGTGLNSAYDFPSSLNVNVAATDMTGATGMYWNLQELRALADFVITEVAPGDENAEPQDLARIHFYRGMAYLMLGENFVAAVLEVEGNPVPARELLNLAVPDFEEALSIGASGVYEHASRAALARTYRALGNASSSADWAQQTLNGSNSLLFTQPFDGTTLVNTPYQFLVERSLKEMQPLPRLDFLDPKYITRNAEIPVLKAEEMHLILAEAALSGGSPDLDQARTHMKNAIALAMDEDAGREVIMFNDNDVRLNNDLNARPRHSLFDVRASPDAPARSGLILDRPGEIPVPVVSHTSFTDDDVDAADNLEDALYLLYNLRQEILFLEGRRVHDLGIRMNFMLREVDSNTNITRESLGAQTFVPSYVPPENQIDLFDPPSPYVGGEPDDEENPTVTTDTIVIMHDLNRILATQRGTVMDNPFVSVPEE